MGSRASHAAASLVAAGAFLSSAGASAETLYAIRPSGTTTANVFKAVVPSGPATVIGDAAMVFNGGLAYSTSAGAMIAIANDALGNSSLTSFTLAAPATTSKPIALGAGFTGGIAYDTDTDSLYAIANDSAGVSTFYSVGATGATAIGALGTGFTGGLTYDSKDHSFYAIRTDGAFMPDKVCRVGLSLGVLSVDTLFDLGGGTTSDRAAARAFSSASAEASVSFLGGIAYDASTGSFVTIGTDGDGTSSVYTFTLNGQATLVKGASIGVVGSNIDLAFAPDAPPIPAVPEPATSALMAAGAVLLAARRRFGARFDRR